jgi:hypothetical protein
MDWNRDLCDRWHDQNTFLSYLTYGGSPELRFPTREQLLGNGNDQRQLSASRQTNQLQALFTVIQSPSKWSTESSVTGCFTGGGAVI